MFCNFYLLKSHKTDNNSPTTETKVKSTDLESLEFYNFFDVYLAKFKNFQILLIKISHRFIVTTKQLSGWKRLIKPAMQIVITLNVIVLSKHGRDWKIF